MQTASMTAPPENSVDLRSHGILSSNMIHANKSLATLTEMACRRQEALLTDQGALVAYTGGRTGRSPRDRFVVADPACKDEVWWGPVNREIDTEVFDKLYKKVADHLQGRDLFVFDGWACADPQHRLNIRVVSEKAWHCQFARCLFLRPPHDQLAGMQPDFTIINACELQADPAVDGTRSEVFVILNLEKKLVLIGGTHYAGEIKKSVFSYLNYVLPRKNVLSMHCSANIGPAGHTALFFGLSGTGKTTLSADPERRLIGDDEHGWSDDGVFNIEGGCYAKTIRLSREGEPQIWNAIRFGSVLENVVIDPLTRRPDFDSDRYTENTRAAYPVDYIDNCEPTGRGGHPKNIVFLTCDAFGVLPPISKLTNDQALYHFLSGYTAKVAGTEAGVTEPEATFSTCFGAPFLPLHPTRYANLLNEKLKKHGSQVWLVNTGWTGGPYGQGKRMKLSHTRAMLKAALSGALANVAFETDPIFGVAVPTSCPDVPADVLNPKNTWKNPAEYDAKAKHLATLFQNNFKTYADQATEAVRSAGPKV